MSAVSTGKHCLICYKIAGILILALCMLEGLMFIPSYYHEKRAAIQYIEDSSLLTLQDFLPQDIHAKALRVHLNQHITRFAQHRFLAVVVQDLDHNVLWSWQQPEHSHRDAHFVQWSAEALKRPYQVTAQISNRFVQQQLRTVFQTSLVSFVIVGTLITFVIMFFLKKVLLTRIFLLKSRLHAASIDLVNADAYVITDIQNNDELGKLMIFVNQLLMKIHQAQEQLSQQEMILRQDNRTLTEKLRLKVLDLEKTNKKLAKEIEHRRAYATKLLHISNYDTETNLPNHSLFAARINTETKQNKNFALYIIELIDFESIVNTFGKELSNHFLIVALKELQEKSKKIQAFARISKQKIALLLDIKDKHHIEDFAKKILHFFFEPIYVFEQQVLTTINIGILLGGQTQQEASELLAQAELALQSAKQQGSNSYQIYQEALNTKASEKNQLLLDLHKALDQQEFVLFYQPIIELSSQRFVGVEALIRWQHPTRGLLFPNEFIMLTEESGLVSNLEQWILATACQQGAHWHQKNLLASIAVNISNSQFHNKNLPETITSALTNSGFNPKFLEIELTESMLVEDVHQAISIMHKLKALGVKLVLDDFGTGYSSLSYLTKFPIDKIKLDKSFIHNIFSCDASASVTKTIIELAHNMKIDVLAEGIENQEDLLYLQDKQCKYGQGFYYSRPLVLDEFEKWRKTYRS